MTQPAIQPRISQGHVLNLRHDAHKAFDRLWQRGLMSRSAAYAKLATMLRLTGEQAHFKLLDADQCKRASEFFAQIEVEAFRANRREHGNRRQKRSRKQFRVRRRELRERDAIDPSNTGEAPCP